MKIAIFKNDLTAVDESSYNCQEIGLARGLVSLGHTVDVYNVSADKHTQHSKKLAKSNGIRIIYLSYSKIPILDTPLYKGIQKCLMAGQYDLVQINDEGGIAAFQEAKACVNCSIPYIIYQGMFQLLSGRSQKLYEKFHSVILRPYIRRNALQVFTKTRKAKVFLSNRGYRNSVVLPVGIDLAPFESPINVDWRERLNLAPGTKLLLYVGSIEERRQPKLMIDMMPLLGSDYHLALIGKGPLLETVKKYIEEKELGNISIVGNLSQRELPSLYRASNCLLLPSTFEIYGMVLLEALYFGLPVLASDSAGPIDILSEPCFGQTLNDFDPLKWVEKVKAQTESNDSFELKEYRSKHIRKKYSWNTIAGDYIRLCNM